MATALVEREALATFVRLAFHKDMRMRTLVLIFVAFLLITTGQSLADRKGRSLGLKAHSIPVTWLKTPEAKTAGDYARNIRHGGLKRYYEVHLPPQYDSKKSWPVVLLLHGGGGNPSGLRWQANMEKEADEKGYILIYPAGTHPLFRDKVLFWNVGPKRKAKSRRKVDDVAFLEAVLDDASHSFLWTLRESMPQEYPMVLI